MADKAVRVVIEGRVQGVWFRGWAMQEATRRGLGGWIRNRRDGTVEAVFAGAADRVDEMVGLCRIGPPAARVMQVTMHSADDPGGGFRSLPTA
ncbi:MAG TPA: acylphosphatase [Rhodospirillales bacterium]|jgi:acylphosphatase